jgi:hypothetical protein
MASMRLVTRKPPKILMPAKNTEIAARMMTRKLLEPICRSAPNIIIDEIALVTAISGVCSEWLTFQITWNPTKTDKTNTIKCCIKLAGA